MRYQNNLIEIYHFLIYHKIMTGTWKVELSGKAKKADKILPKNTHKTFAQLLLELGSGPEKPHWPNYGKLGPMTYHCHLKKGRPTYVVCWTADKKNKLIEVYYAGTHENAPY